MRNLGKGLGNRTLFPNFSFLILVLDANMCFHVEMKRTLSLAALAVFLCTGLVFFIYSFLVRTPSQAIPVAIHAAVQSGSSTAPTSTAVTIASSSPRERVLVSPSVILPARIASSSEAVALATSSSSPSLSVTQKGPKLLLDVPFSVQAPLGVWDAVHEETCEETAVMLVAAFYDGERGVIPPKTADARILRIVAIENDLLGVYKDTSAADTAAFARKAYPNVTAKVVSLKSIDDLKSLLRQGMPVILPTAGKMLKNPNFKNGGPVYHMIVATGYTNGSFITNDPGTRRGRSYIYDEKLLFAAIHDWNGGDVLNGKKVGIILQPK